MSDVRRVIAEANKGTKPGCGNPPEFKAQRPCVNHKYSANVQLTGWCSDQDVSHLLTLIVQLEKASVRCYASCIHLPTRAPVQGTAASLLYLSTGTGNCLAVESRFSQHPADRSCVTSHQPAVTLSAHNFVPEMLPPEVNGSRELQPCSPIPARGSFAKIRSSRPRFVPSRNFASSSGRSIDVQAASNSNPSRWLHSCLRFFVRKRRDELRPFSAVAGNDTISHQDG